jgi:hypothetical protein
MAHTTIAPDRETLASQNAADTLISEERVLAYLRAAMLESGDNPNVMAVALCNAEEALAQLQRRAPSRVGQPAAGIRRSAQRTR